MGLLLLGAAAAEAQTSRILVSNVSQGSDDVANTSGNDHAQLFHTGDHTDGYTLTSVTVVSEDAEGDAFDVDICTADTTANEFPTSTCTALDAPMSFAAGNLEFTESLALSANTNYVVVIKSSANVRLNSTPSGGEDSSLGLSGWTIKDYFYWNNSGTWTNESGTDRALPGWTGSSASPGCPCSMLRENGCCSTKWTCFRTTPGPRREPNYRYRTPRPRRRE